MWELGFVALVAFLAWLAAGAVNIFVGVLSGERPRDTGRVWRDLFLGVFGLFELGYLGRMLNASSTRWARKLLYLAGLAFLIFWLLR